MSDANLNIDLHYITRVEGHGNIVVDAKNGKVEKVQWQVPEAPRFFEAMVVGQKWDVIHHITSRICGICSIGHTLASLKATEAAMGIKISEQTHNYRRLAIHAENLQSHILHIGYLVLPDLMGVGSVIPLASSHPEDVKYESKKEISLHANDLFTTLELGKSIGLALPDIYIIGIQPAKVEQGMILSDEVEAALGKLPTEIKELVEGTFPSC